MAIRARLARIDRTLGSATSRFEDLQDKISGQLEEIQSEIQKMQSDVQTNIGDITDWKPTGFVLDTDAILNDPEAQRLAKVINELRGERNGKAILAGFGRRAQARIQAILEAAGLDLTPEDRRAIAVLAGRIFIDERWHTLAAGFHTHSGEAALSGTAAVSFGLGRDGPRLMSRHCRIGNMAPCTNLRRHPIRRT